MTALSDQSTMTIWPWWVWPLAVAFVLFVAYLLEQKHYRNRDEPVPYLPVDLDKPVEFYPVCATRGCRYPARVKVESFTGLVTVCHGCADEGIAHGWFTAA